MWSFTVVTLMKVNTMRTGKETKDNIKLDLREIHYEDVNCLRIMPVAGSGISSVESLSSVITVRYEDAPVVYSRMIIF